MPSKYPGGYQIIDLKGQINVSGDSVTIPGAYDLIKHGKPVVLTGYEATDANDIPSNWPPYLPLVGIGMSDEYVFGLAMLDGDGAYLAYDVIITVDIDDSVSLVEP